MAKPKGGLGVVIMMGKRGGGEPDAPATPEQRRQHAADVEASFLGRPQPNGTFDADHDGGKVSARTAGYLELEGAQKSGDCDLVEVPGGVSAARGCCNLFAAKPAAEEFCCGECVHYEGRGASGAGEQFTGDSEQGRRAIPEAVNG